MIIFDDIMNTVDSKKVDKMRDQTQYNVDEILALSVAIDRTQGFIRSGYGYRDQDGKTIEDNKSAIVAAIKGASTVDVTEQDRATAQELKEYFASSLTFKKLGVNLNDFEETVLQLVSTEQTDLFGISVAASLPNSMRHSTRRDAVKEKLDQLIVSSSPVGAMMKRGKFTLDVIDVTYIKKMGVHMVTCVESGKNIVKFWFSKDPDLSGIIEDRTIVVTGFVKSHGVSKYSNCMETMINRVKIEFIKG